MMCKRIFHRLWAACLLLLALPLQVFAAGYIDTSRSTNLTIVHAYEETVLVGVEFQIYQLGTVAANGEFTVMDTFRDYEAQLDIRGENEAAWREIALTLEQDILLGALGDIQPAASAVTNADGRACFASVAQGLYLVLGTRTEYEGYVYTTVPMILSLPDRQTDGWNYDVTAYAKPEKNPVRMPLEVIKIWKDDGYTKERPNTITVQLFCDGVAYGDAVFLSAADGWTYTWNDLDVNCYWSIDEAPVGGYLPPIVEREGNTFIITNTYDEPPPPDEPKLPQTGQAWWPVPILMAAGLLLVVMGLVTKRRPKYEK